MSTNRSKKTKPAKKEEVKTNNIVELDEVKAELELEIAPEEVVNAEASKICNDLSQFTAFSTSDLPGVTMIDDHGVRIAYITKTDSGYDCAVIPELYHSSVWEDVCVKDSFQFIRHCESPRSICFSIKDIDISDVISKFRDAAQYVSAGVFDVYAGRKEI